ncbi:LysR family transcriptional regulator [Kiloniella laminariae]|uniref:LysR family transcriptional regulator n=1 Tax=Kiloniella laminariae TaxID=454162 RepID=A0ABT4LDK6_9PROT|nr:LysR family transcriptional regulator [Kiloniella laminariae]MCZ4279193.1 LysR family transcriptional regulator [Kiloniella laminariae]
MNLTHLETFLEIAETGNFNKAAENLHVTQSTVSARVKALEDSLGRSLFKRNHNGVELSPAGRQLQRYTASMLRLWKQARHEVCLPPGLNATLALSSQFSLWSRLILHWMPWMRQHAPDVALRLDTNYSNAMMRQLSDGVLDIGVMYSPRQIPGLRIEKLLEEQLVMVSTSPLNEPDDWRKDYILVDWGDVFRNIHNEHFPDMATPPIYVGLGDLGLRYILENGGSGYFPMRVVRPHLQIGELFLVPDTPTIQRPAYMVYAKSSNNKALVDQALDGLRIIAASESEE